MLVGWQNMGDLMVHYPTLRQRVAAKTPTRRCAELAVRDCLELQLFRASGMRFEQLTASSSEERNASWPHECLDVQCFSTVYTIPMKRKYHGLLMVA